MSIAMRMIDYMPELEIRNLDMLPKGTGCKYLVVIPGIHRNEFIAKRWKREIPFNEKLSSIERIIRF